MRSLSFLLLLAGACSAYDTDIGPTPYLCGETDPACPEGYACVDDLATGERVCVNGSVSADFECEDDSALEPNNLLAAATTTGLDGERTYGRERLSICPAGDRDLFAITIASEGATIELVAEFQANGAPLVGTILNAGGIPVATSVSHPDDPTQVRAVASNLSPGTYYAQVAADASTSLTLNNYTLALEITGP